MRSHLSLFLTLFLLCGCSSDDDDSDSETPSNVHPAGYAAATAHGLDANQASLDCQSCHGADLQGSGAAVSCDLCHTPTQPLAWRSDCTFCHGGTENETGAPPQLIDNGTDQVGNPFPLHDRHVSSVLTSNVDCQQCHQRVSDVLTEGHMFDGTAGQAEVDFAGGVSPQGQFNAETGCSNTYCHGGGRVDDGVVTINDGAMTCSSCHAGNATDPDADLDAMSGFHRLHVKDAGNPATCNECHSTTTADSSSILDPALHINGLKEVSISEVNFTYEADTTNCNGTCHGVTHTNFSWIPAQGSFHPANYAQANVHGADMVLQRSDCRGCHGATLAGGVGNSCDQCHDPLAPTAWRSDCTFCHGGIDNNTGAPPHDLAAPNDAQASSFMAHSAHVMDGIGSALSCTSCHVQPSDVLSSNHAFDDTPGVAEVDMSQSLSAAASYANGSCNNVYCHGSGLANGAVNDGDVMACNSCHAFLGDGNAALNRMSGDHRIHFGEGITCADCHNSVTQDDQTFVDLSLHVDGTNQVVFEVDTITYVEGRCNGPCHGEDHNNDIW